MAAAINRLAGALCFNNGDNVEERLREFLAVSANAMVFPSSKLSFRNIQLRSLSLNRIKY